jgi:hypothetical protein
MAERLLVAVHHTALAIHRQPFAEGAPVPRKFGRPEVIEILREYYAGLE